MAKAEAIQFLRDSYGVFIKKGAYKYAKGLPISFNQKTQKKVADPSICQPKVYIHLAPYND